MHGTCAFVAKPDSNCKTLGTLELISPLSLAISVALSFAHTPSIPLTPARQLCVSWGPNKWGRGLQRWTVATTPHREGCSLVEKDAPLCSFVNLMMLGIQRGSNRVTGHRALNS